MKPYRRLFTEAKKYPDPKFKIKGKDKLLKEVPVAYIDDTQNKGSSFYEGFTKYIAEDGTALVKPENEEFYRKMYLQSLEDIDKYGKKFGISSKQYKHSYTSRGGWAMYVSKTNNPKDKAILVDYDKRKYYVEEIK